MLELAERRLGHFGERARLVQADSVETGFDRPFEVVLMLGGFQLYACEPADFVRRARRSCSGAVVASFPRWSWVKGPVRKFRYEVVNDCPIFYYTDAELRFLFGTAGFSRCDVVKRGRTGYLVRADV